MFLFPSSMFLVELAIELVTNRSPTSNIFKIILISESKPILTHIINIKMALSPQPYQYRCRLNDRNFLTPLYSNPYSYGANRNLSIQNQSPLRKFDKTVPHPDHILPKNSGEEYFKVQEKGLKPLTFNLTHQNFNMYQPPFPHANLPRKNSNLRNFESSCSVVLPKVNKNSGTIAVSPSSTSFIIHERQNEMRRSMSLTKNGEMAMVAA
jgi:hypothetical protein